MSLEEKKENLEISKLNIEEHQYLTFLVQGEMFAIEVLHINEIIGYGNITEIPTMQDFVKGITNIRGNVLPVIDLSLRLKLGLSEPNKRTCIIIVETIMEENRTNIGLVVDLVNQVYNIFPENIENTPTFGTKVKKDFIKGIGKSDNKFITILNLDNLLNINELSKVQAKY